MDVYKFARMIQVHEADFYEWLDAIFDSNENASFEELEDEFFSCLSRAVSISSVYDRQQAAINLRRSLRNHEENMRVWSRTEPDHMWAAENGRQLGMMLIKMIEP